MSTPQPLRLGMFVMPIHDPKKPLAQCIDEDLELAVLCEELGFDDFWVGEHHSSSVENIVMPEIFLAKVLGMTHRMRVGPAPVCLQYHHPVHVATGVRVTGAAAGPRTRRARATRRAGGHARAPARAAPGRAPPSASR